MKSSKHPFRLSWWPSRALAVAIIPFLVLTSFPVEALAVTNPAVPLAAPMPKTATINRTVPQVAAPLLWPAFSSRPTDAEIRRARVFEEPLVAMGGKASAAENKTLAEALMAYLKRSDTDDTSSITRFLAQHPQSPWRASLLANLGMTYRRTGHFSKALATLEEAWKLSKNETGLEPRAIADRSVGELAELSAQLGHEQRLASLLAELAGRDLRGPATEKLATARQGLWQMRNPSVEALHCGPYALSRVLAALRPADAFDRRLRDAHATRQGMSLTQVAALAKRLKMNYRMARRQPGAPIPVPAVVHWKMGHYGALVKEENGRYLLQDSAVNATSQGQAWVSQAALDAEASGYFLIPAGKWPAGWQAISKKEGQTVWGKGFTDTDPPPPPPPDPPCGGMAVYSFQPMPVGLLVTDTAVGYTPPHGPNMPFTVSYNQREGSQPAVFSYANLGAKWTFNWLSYISDDPRNPSADATLFAQRGGTELYTRFNTTTQAYAPQLESAAVLVRTSPTSYERRLPDGSREIFDRPDGAATSPRKVFLTQIIDPVGNTVRLTYDDRLRLMTIRDALGQVTTLFYELARDVLKITKVTDPFGRSATFDYNDTGQLVRITDVIGLTSQFTYGTGNFINTLTTPYGATRFTTGEGPNLTRWVEATDPLGETERIEFRHQAPGISLQDPVVPTGFYNYWMYFRNTFYWNKKAYREAEAGRDDRRDYTKAKIFHWLHGIPSNMTGRVLESVKEPLENRVWYTYPGQSNPIFLADTTHAQPAKIGRVLDDGTTQLSQNEYNRLGKLTKTTDPVGRTTSFIYDAANEIDLLEVRQTRGAGTDLLAKFTHNAQHRPLTVTDAAGQTYTFAYNAFGQVLTVTNPKNETTTFMYDANGYLTQITRPAPGATVSFTYDGFGRIRTATDSEGYSLQFDYDNLDRVTQVTYPDGTFDQNVYNRLDLEQTVDRLGNVTRRSYNARRQLLSVQDAEGRTVRLDWCSCGDLQKMTDALGRETTWNRDVQGRVTSKVFPDGREVQYTYDSSSGRLVEQTDAKGQTKQYEYYRDNNLKQVSYPDAPTPTPSVSFTYDPYYNRVVTMQDGVGRTTYTYHLVTSPPTRGAGLLAAVSGPLPDSTVTYTYDELNRLAGRTVNGAAESITYDTLGRPVAMTNPLGAFRYNYVNTTDRLSSILYPNQQSTRLTYYDATGDQRLQEVQNLDPTGSVLSQFDYTYDANGQITTWTKQLGAALSANYGFKYDGTGQLLSAVLQSNQIKGSLPSQYVYQYDDAGNRTGEQIGDALTQSSYNELNQLSSQQADVLPDPDTTSRRSDVTYDGLRRRVHIVDKENDAVVSDRWLVWCGTEICEERDGTGRTATKRFYAQGVAVLRGDNPGNYYYTFDHLGSIREVTDADGMLRAQYDYDPYGRRVQVDGDLDFDFGFTGHYYHPPSGLHLALFRAYDANLARWISRDPLAEIGGINLYSYVINQPLLLVDPEGAFPPLLLAMGVGAVIGGTIGGVTAYLRGQNVLAGIGTGALAGGVGVLGGAAGAALAGSLGIGGVAGGILGGALSGAASDAASQGALIATGAQQCFDPWSVAISGLIGGLTGGWYASGREIRLGPDFRIAPFGNRTGNPLGERPHFHQRIVDPATGQTIPGGGIGRHRPWE